MKWVWCNTCNCAAVICPNCGNNVCNGSSKDGCKDRCQSAYDYQHGCYEDGTAPDREHCDGELPDDMGMLRGMEEYNINETTRK